jgi:hypothetical protein
MLRSEQGPVAVFCGSRVTMPYGMAVMCDALMDEFFHQRRSTLGALVLHAKRRMLQAAPDSSRRQMLDALAMALSPQRDRLDAERREHVHLFNLLGDPLLRLPQPVRVSLKSDAAVTAGEALRVAVVCPIEGEGIVEFVCRRDRARAELPPRRVRFEPTHRFLASFDKTYKQIINLSVNQTLSRTILTSVTTLIVLLVLFFFGGIAINNFVLVMILGVAVGTYSSIFVACPIVAVSVRPSALAGIGSRVTFQ